MLIKTRNVLLIAVTVALLLACGVAVTAAEEISAPGGEVSSDEELIAALGGEKAVSDEDGYLLLRSDIRLEKPVILLDGDYLLSGGGCRITASFDDDSFFIIGDGEKEASLRIGSSDAQTDNDSVIFDGEGKSFAGSFLCIRPKGTVEIFVGTVFSDAVSTACGAAVYNEGTMSLYGGKIENCRATGSGGAFFNKGHMFLAGGRVSDCSADFGGGVYNEGQLDLIGTELLSCSAGKGGAVFNSGTLHFRSSSVTDASAEAGGGVYNSGTADFEGGQILTSAASDCGGALYNSGNATLSGTYFSGNSALSGGTAFNAAVLTISDGQIYEGTASGNGGNFYNDKKAEMTVSGGTIGRGSAVFGGGIFNLGKLTVSGGGFSSNKAEAGQAILNDGSLIFTDHPYIDGRNDVMIVAAEQHAHAASVETEMKAETVAVLTPGVKEGENYRAEYTAGVVLITGPYAAASSQHFAVSSDGRTEWVMTEDGSFREKLPVYFEAWFYLVLIAAFAATVIVLVVGIRFSDRRMRRNRTA